MADLIDRDEVKRELNAQYAIAKNTANPDSVEQVLRAVSKFFDSFPAANRWISCAEQLPERETDVLVYIPVWKDNPIQVAYLMYDGITWELSDGEFNFGKREVLYWMSLPNKPEVNSDAESNSEKS